MKINKEQRNILIISAALFLVFIILWFFFYFPQRNKLILIKRDLNNTEAQISQIIALGGGKELGLTTQDLLNHLNKLRGKFAASEGEIINILSKEAEKLKINIKNITPRQKINQAISGDAGNYLCQELPLALNLITEFKNLGDYLDILENKLLFLISIKELRINNQASAAQEINVYLDLSVYLLKDL